MDSSPLVGIAVINADSVLRKSGGNVCSYQGYEFGAGSYPDSVCIDGRLFDADRCDESGMLLEIDEDIPCPMCREQDAIKYWTEQNRNGGHTTRESRVKAKSLIADIRKNRKNGTEPWKVSVR